MVDDFDIETLKALTPEKYQELTAHQMARVNAFLAAPVIDVLRMLVGHIGARETLVLSVSVTASIAVEVDAPKEDIKEMYTAMLDSFECIQAAYDMAEIANADNDNPHTQH